MDTGIVHSSSSTNNYFFVNQLVAEGIVFDQNTVLGLFATVLSMKVSPMEATKQTIASMLIKQLWNVYALI